MSEPTLQSALFAHRAKVPTNGVDNNSLGELDSIGACEIFDQDPRPTLILDLGSDLLDYGGSKNDLHPIFCNAALRERNRLLDSVTSANDAVTKDLSDSTTYFKFRSWATSISKFDDSKVVYPQSLLYRNMLWTGCTIRRRWRVINGNQYSHGPDLQNEDFLQESQAEKARGEPRTSPDKTTLTASNMTVQPPITPTQSSKPTLRESLALPMVSPAFVEERSSNKTSDNTSNDTSGSSASITLTSPEFGVPDWTMAKPQGFISEHIKFARDVNWAATPLGPMESWSVQFREIANLVMRNPHPAALFWGEELTMLYNEAYQTEVAGNKHPKLMGTGFSGPFSEVWDKVGPVFRECARTGTSIRRENERLPIERYGYLEETFFSWSFTPVYGGTNRILGFYNAPFETTYQTISERRLQTLRLLGEKLAEARSVNHYWKCVLDGLEDNHYDIPFAVLYSITDIDEGESASHSSDSTISSKTCILEGSIGVPQGHKSSPPKLDLKNSKEGFIPAFRKAMRTREPTILHTRNGSLPEELIQGIQWRGHGDPCTDAVIIPVRPTNGENIFAFLLLGMNPHRAYDENYKAFVNMLNRLLTTSLASFLLFEEEVSRSRNAAEAATLQREKLTQQLAIQANRMRRMTELSPLGMYLFGPDGVLLEANERYYEMTGHNRDDDEPYAFLKQVADDESCRRAKSMWNNLIMDSKPCQEELQLKNPRSISRDLEGEPIEYWVLSSSQPEVGPDGQLISIMGSITDISHMKWAQGLQERRLREAEETKRQQNEFIDMTSHEMRNPLSAVLICADDIRDTLSKHQFFDTDKWVIEDCIEAANNIALCVQHQKSIVDDILTISKLDSNLLLITPVPVQPVAVVQRAINMFKPEVQAKDIEFHFHPNSSLWELDVDWVNLDPSRLLQITINLITNAIKFTQGSHKRLIALHLTASLEQPKLQTRGFEYVPTRSSLVEITASEDWGPGDLLYIQIQVADTGCGLTEEEKRVLFERFAQASPRTHAQYGGSGLGLFISRQLAELHGGQIGVSSEAGIGSTFGFFIQARRTTAPETQLHMDLATSKAIHVTTTSGAQDSVSTVNPSSDISVAEHPAAEDSLHRLNSRELHILLVEDNLVNQRVLSKQLRKAGCTVYTADNGIEALDSLSNTHFKQPAGIPLSVVLMDLEMPEMDGLTCVKRIREMETEGALRGHVPIIAVTANVRNEQRVAAIRSGFDDFASKPFRLLDLLARIRALLEKLSGERYSDNPH